MKCAMLPRAASPTVMLCLTWRSFPVCLRITSLRTLPHSSYINCSRNDNCLKPHCISNSGLSPVSSVILGSHGGCSDTRERATPLHGFAPCALGSSAVQEIVANQRQNIDIAKTTVYIPVKKAAAKTVRTTE